MSFKERSNGDMMTYDLANRLKNIPPYLFADIEEKVSKKRAQGVDIIDFGIGDPDIPTPRPIVEEDQKATGRPREPQVPIVAG